MRRICGRVRGVTHVVMRSSKRLDLGSVSLPPKRRNIMLTEFLGPRSARLRGVAFSYDGYVIA